jgi:N-acyl-D-aspartate/D-glutamate deacylase
MVRIAEASGRPLTYIIHSYNHAPDEWRELFAASDTANARGLNIRPQIAARGLGLLLGLDGRHIFRNRPSYREIEHLDRLDRAAAMRNPARRAAILSEANLLAPGVNAQLIEASFEQILDRFYVLEPQLDYEPDESKRLNVIAERTGRSMPEVLYDTLAAGDGQGLAILFALNYTHGNLDSVYEMLQHPATVSGLGDGGAHLQLVCDAAMPTFQLSFWARDRVRGPKLPLELMVAKLTGDLAKLYGFLDRGVLKPGRRADINVIDFERLGNAMPEMRFDLPLGGKRYVQCGHGYLATLVNGTITRENDEDTGARPGTLLRLC